MKKINLFDEGNFNDIAFKTLLVHDSENFKILNFNFRAGQELGVHSHDIDGEVSITIIEGTGEFLAADNATIPAKPGDVLVCKIKVPHGIRATTDMRALVTIAPPI
ncbi:MAG: cupin domain-containing protein [Desulfoplanes sp.]|nr:cupin domain-containing protein [Desulfoplanes sp.]